MKDTAKKHQEKIARATLRMTPEMARIMGGMTFSKAYEFIFHRDLKERLTGLIAEYPDCEPWQLNTELCTFGWSGTKALQELLTRIEND